MKILHCADIHLDSSLRTNLTGEQAAIRNNEILLTFKDMIEYGRREGVKIVLIAGDLFDSDIRSPKTIQVLADCIQTNTDMDFLYIRGNHDENKPLSELEGLPNFRVFERGICAYRYGRVCITGISELSMCRYLRLSAADINIVVFHGELSKKDMPSGLNIDYMAAGHIHRYGVQRIDDRGIFCYSGCLEPRGFDECVQTGFVIAEMNEQIPAEQTGNVRIKFVPFGRRQAHIVSVRMQADTTTPSLCRMIEDSSAGISSGDIVKAELTGETAPGQSIDYTYIEQYFKERFFAFRLDDKTAVSRRAETAKAVGPIGERFVKLVMDSEEPEDVKKFILEKGLNALRGVY